ncbi:MAG: molecular chaperone DnaK, partial [Candidatus Parcubacteria bacterium]|nr:molecular chaperone DnaK [Candidatus Parcubacteria bacterium]
AETATKDAGDKITPDLKEKLESKIKHLKDVTAQNNLEEIKLASEDLSTTLQEIGKAMYQSKEEPKKEEPTKDNPQPGPGETKT